MIVQTKGEPFDYPTAEWLESETGADLLVSPVQAPVLPATLKLHIESGALLIQRKSGLDLAASVGDRLWSSLTRMRATGARPYQCVLLYTGVWLPDAGDSAMLAQPDLSKLVYTWHYSHPDARVPYTAVMSVLAKWCWYGGCVQHLPAHSMIPVWLAHIDRLLNESACKSVREVYPPLVDLREVDDWRAIAAALPGIGPVRATALREAMLAHGAQDTLIQALTWLTEYIAVERVPGIGRKTCDRVREALGLSDGEYIDIRHE